MVTVRCTRRLLSHLKVRPVEHPVPATGRLGDWYANLIFTEAGDLILFVNERTLLSVAIPVWEVDNLLEVFRLRVANLLAMIGVSSSSILTETGHLANVEFGRTANRSLLSSMNDIALQYQLTAEDHSHDRPLSLSDAESEVSQMPCRLLGHRAPREVALELLLDSNDGAS